MDDASYKRLLNHRRIMQDLLIGFIAPRRPAGWAGALDFGSLRELPTENITDELRRRLGDVVWSIDRRAGDGGVQTLHVVIEHQSDVDYSMPLRFLNYTSLLYQRLYRDRTRWSKRDTADPVLQVVVYNGDRRWDAPVTLAGLVAGLEQDGPAQLALSYEVVDLVALKRDDLPRPNLLTWVAEVEQSVHAGALPERVRELGEWLAAEGEPGLTTTFDLWLGAMGRKWGVELPSIREYEEASAVLAEKIDRWGAEILEQGIEQGIEQGTEQGIKQGIKRGLEQGIEQGIEQGLLESIREVLELRFGAGAAEPSATHLEAIGGDVQRLKQLHRAAIQAPDLDAFRRLLAAAD